MKVILSHAIVPEAMQLLDGCETKVLNTRDMAENKADIADADAIVARISHVNAEAIEAAKNLKVIGRTGVGYDMVDVQAATARGIPVVLTPGANNRSVAEHTVALLFALSKNLVEGHNEQMKGNYAIRNKGVAFELLDKTIMVLGLGAIGGEVARLCKAIGMNVLGYDPFLPEDKMAALGCEPVKDYKAALPRCDFVTVHMPLLDSTRNMIGEAEIASMKPTAMIVNCARGGIVDEKALAAALNEDRLAGAGIDCFENDEAEYYIDVFCNPDLTGTLQDYINDIQSDPYFQNIFLGVQGDLFCLTYETEDEGERAVTAVFNTGDGHYIEIIFTGFDEETVNKMIHSIKPDPA